MNPGIGEWNESWAYEGGTNKSISYIQRPFGLLMMDMLRRLDIEDAAKLLRASQTLPPKRDPQILEREWGLSIEGNNTTTPARMSLLEFFLPIYIFTIIVTVLGFLGNGILIIVHLRRKTERGRVQIMYHFIFVMAILDFLTCSLILPIDITFFATQYQAIPVAACKLMAYGRLMSVYGSMFILVAIAAERYLSVCHPFKADGLLSQRKALLLSAACIVVASLTAAPNFFLFKVIWSDDVKMRRCQLDESAAKESFIFAIALLVIFLLCLAILIVLYSLVYMKVLRKDRKREKMRNKLQTNSGNTGGKQRIGEFKKRIQGTKGELLSKRPLEKSTGINNDKVLIDKTNKLTKKEGVLGRLRKISSTAARNKQQAQSGGGTATRTGSMLLLVTIVFIATWLPYWIINIVSVLFPLFLATRTELEMQIITFFANFFYINNAVNPIIYTFTSHTFRKEILENLTCKSRSWNSFKLDKHKTTKTRQEYKKTREETHSKTILIKM